MKDAGIERLTETESTLTTAGKPVRNKLFISYSHQDKPHFERLLVHLKPLERDKRIDRWDDTRIKSGEKWHEEIRRAIERSGVAILLISADFLASDFINEIEVPLMLAGAAGFGAIILPVILSPCSFTSTQPLFEFQAVNDPAQPLSGLDWNAQERLWDKVAKEVLKALRIPIFNAAKSVTEPVPSTAASQI